MRLSERLHNALFALFLLAMAGYGVAFAAHMLTQFDIINLARDVNVDDSFYYFEIASNMAEGQFSTFDGGITRTNGYHPLWLWLITPFYWFLDKEAALFAIKAFEILLIAGAAMLVTVAARLARLPWILLVALLPTLYQTQALYLGLEAAAGLFTLALFLLALVLYGRDASRWHRLLAAVAFALPWARLEYVAISLAGTGALLLLEWTWRERRRGKARFTLLNLRTFVPMFGAIAGILSYFAYNQLVFGGPVPVSGATKQAWAQSYWHRTGGHDLLQNLRDMMALPVFDDELLAAAGICAGAALLWWLLRRGQRREDRLLLVFLAGVASLAVGHLGRFALSGLTVNPDESFWPWYFAPAYLMMALAAPLAGWVALAGIRHVITPRSLRAGKWLGAGLIVLGTVAAGRSAGFLAPFGLVESYADDLRIGWTTIHHLSSLTVNRLLPERSIIGSWDSGTIGYFSEFPVVNLDGVVNDYAYLRKYAQQGHWGGGVYSQRETFAQTLHERFGTDWFANDWVDDDLHRFENTLYEGWGKYLPDIRKGMTFMLWTAGSSGEVDPGAWFQERMASQFDTLEGGVGLMVDGRLTQAFTQDCGPGDWLLWRWSQGAVDRRMAGEAWTKKQTGLCVAARILPQGAGPEVSAETLGREALLAELIGDAAPAIAADFEVWLADRQLVYRRQDCAAEDVEARFFLHIVPLEVGDLPEWRQQFGFDNLDFYLEEHGARDGETCMALAPLPTYGIAAIRTGQYVARDEDLENLWTGTIRPA